MGRQVGFLADDEDYADLVAAIERIGLMAVPQIAPTDTIPDLRRPSAYVVPEDQWFFYLLPDEFAAVEAFYDELTTDPTRSMLSHFSSPVIQFAPCRREGDKLLTSRIYLTTDLSDPRYDVVRRKYERLARYLGKWHRLRTQHNFRVGPHTLQCAREGKIRFYHGHLEITDLL